MENKAIFITGIDTNVGKTYATGILARSLAAKGKKVTTYKMIQTGCEKISEDIEMHRRLMGEPLSEDDKEGRSCGYLFKYPCSPHMAAEMEKRPIDMVHMSTSINYRKEHNDYTLIEGAGGLMVPLDFEKLTIDFIAGNRYPVVLVTSGKLGSINHTVLSLFACRTYGIKVAAVIYNRYPQIDKAIEDNTFQYLERYISNNCPGTQLLVLPEEKEEHTFVFDNLWF
ncbi:dethiobiotin synthase [Parabacteroides sp.]